MKKNWRKMLAAENAEKKLPILISPAFQKLIDKASPADAQALKKQVIPSENENYFSNEETADPLGEDRYCITPFLVHQYKNRVLLLATGKCLSYCRYCFRRGFTSRETGFITEKQIKTVSSYIKSVSHIKEVLVSGGDPLSGGTAGLQALLKELRPISPDLIIRICTRAPVFAPELFTAQLIGLLKQNKPLWLIPHINHPAELGSAQVNAIENCVNAGIPVQSQTVLLKGVNDSPDILIALFHKLTCLGIKPGYLFQLDSAFGTKHFKVELKKALALWEILKKELSGLSLPQFAVDLPNGGGKFPLSAIALYEKITVAEDCNSFSAIGIDGKKYIYI